MARISEEQVRHVAHLARLVITDEEVALFTKQLDELICLVEDLAEVNTDNVAPLSHPLTTEKVMREDKVGPTLSVEEVLKNAPDQENGQFKVPAILD